MNDSEKKDIKKIGAHILAFFVVITAARSAEVKNPDPEVAIKGIKATGVALVAVILIIILYFIIYK